MACGRKKGEESVSLISLWYVPRIEDASWPSSSKSGFFKPGNSRRAFVSSGIE